MSLWILASVCTAATTLRGQDVTWTGLGTDNNLSNPANWTPTAPQDGDALIFGVNAGNRYEVLADEIFEVLSVRFATNIQNAYDIHGLPIWLKQEINNRSDVRQDFSNTVQITGNAEVKGGPLWLSQLVNGAGDAQFINSIRLPDSLDIDELWISHDANVQTFHMPGTGNTVIKVIRNGPAASGNFDYRSTGYLDLKGGSTYTGTTSLGGTPVGNLTDLSPLTNFGSGNVILNFAAPGAPTNNILYNGVMPNSLFLGGTTLEVAGEAGESNTQAFGNVLVNTGFSRVILEPGAAGNVQLNLGTLSRNNTLAGVGRTGNVNFVIPAGATVTTQTVNLPAGGGGLLAMDFAATINHQDWAVNGTNAAGGPIVPFTNYVANNATFTGMSQGANVNFVADAMVSVSTAVNTLRFDAPSAAPFTNTLSMGAAGAVYLNAGAVLVTPDVGASDVTITGGFLIGKKDDSLDLMNFNPQGSLIVNSIIADHTLTPTTLNILGGPVTLGGTNSYSGGTVISDACVHISHNRNLGSQSAGAPIVLDGATIKILTNVTLSNGALSNSPRRIGLSNSGGTFDTNDCTFVVPGVISGGDLNVIGGGVGVFVGDNTFDDLFIDVDTVVQLGSNTATGTAGTGDILNNGGLVFYHSNDFLVPNDIRGTGSILHFGNNRVIRSGFSNYDGGTTVQAGSFVFAEGWHKIGVLDGDGDITVEEPAHVILDRILADELDVVGNLLVRQAIAFAVDRNSIVEAVRIAHSPPALNLVPADDAGPLAAAASTYTGRLDLNNTALIVRSTGVSEKAAKAQDIAAAIEAARDGGGGGVGSWTGNGITSSTVAADAANYTLALADNADLHYTLFRGTAVDDNALIIVQAPHGDANLDLKVNAFDLNLLAAHWQQDSGAFWSGGDFNGDHKVNAFDLNILAGKWQFGAALVPPEGSASPAAGVPEPASLLMLLGAMLMMVCRRFHRGRNPS